ncbi:hypothetical protein AGR5A_Lc110029 [Agrobacterium genomosp. 5 str. CFBP 6626]|nr:hypothetical protein AGR5A_Lc110029 [Agrobacterium genomosp. 5 str. CFBP 6626]
MQSAELRSRHHQHDSADGQHRNRLLRCRPHAPSGINRIHDQLVEKRPCRTDQEQGPVQCQREGRWKKEKPRHQRESQLAGIDEAMEIIDRRWQTENVKTDKIGSHQGQRQHIERVKTRKARLHEKAGRYRAFAQFYAIGMRQHETAERKEQIDGEIARRRALSEKHLGMTVHDKEGGHTPYAIEQYEAFRGRLDHGRGCSVGLNDIYSIKTRFSAQRFTASSHKLFNAARTPHSYGASTRGQRSFAVAKGMLRPDVIDALNL